MRVANSFVWVFCMTLGDLQRHCVIWTGNNNGVVFQLKKSGGQCLYTRSLQSTPGRHQHEVAESPERAIFNFVTQVTEA